MSLMDCMPNLQCPVDADVSLSLDSWAAESIFCTVEDFCLVCSSGVAVLGGSSAYSGDSWSGTDVSADISDVFALTPGNQRTRIVSKCVVVNSYCYVLLRIRSMLLRIQVSA